MTFHKVEDDPSNELFFLHYSENDKIFISILPVMFGYRVIVGYVRLITTCHELNYCAGSNQEDVESLFATIKAILETIDEDSFSTSFFPEQTVKPVIKTECFQKLKKLAGEHEEVDMPPVSRYRNEVFSNLHPDMVSLINSLNK